MEQTAQQARTEELRRSYLILAREWHLLADRHTVRSPSIPSVGALERLAIELELETSR